MENKFTEYLELFKSKKIKLTDVRTAMLKIIASKKHFTINELISMVEKDLGSVNVMSIYNNIDLFLDLHLLFANTINGKQIIYEAISPQLMHIFCDKCGFLEHLESPSLANELFVRFSSILEDKKMELEHFKLELHGICNKCKENKA
ncbi:Fur family transcriptional regulator [Spiroplasma diminutum]|uniref:Fur family transcriptional regulator n=1 Tax=Spiroplasma diminutum CUAS-1 TaxID=1276221 RepID=S5LX93_9MOLU|nr:transcriptional repressor [Spiroplasma diminutum]AGR42434.1 Fur family transcriptional regulator [Spiroplasma diminutum CUAS-1]